MVEKFACSLTENDHMLPRLYFEKIKANKKLTVALQKFGEKFKIIWFQTVSNLNRNCQNQNQVNPLN